MKKTKYLQKLPVEFLYSIYYFFKEDGIMDTINMINYFIITLFTESY